MPVKNRGVIINPVALQEIVDKSPQLDEMLKRRANEIADTAKVVFEAQERHFNENRLSETTPPKYIASFKVHKIKKAKGYAWVVRNDDPGAVWVEYGAHAGGKTFVLRYRPLGTALDVVGGLR